MATPKESALATTCKDCGAAVPIVFCEGSPPCRHCGTHSPLADAVGQRVAKVRARVVSQEARSQQLIGKQANLGRLYGVGLLIAMLCLWVLIFGVGWLMFEPPEQLGFLELMAGGHPAKSWDILGRYWLTWATLAGVGMTVLGYGITMISMRRLIRFALPRAPLTSGAPPRCRVCGAELGLQGRVRRCEYCAADHLVMGDRYVREDARLDGELSRMERELGATLERRVQRADRWLWRFAGFMPLVTIFVVPAAALTLGTPTHGLVWIPVIALVLGGVLLAVGSSMSVPDIRTREAANAGDTLLVQGTPMKSMARMSFGLWPFSGQLFLVRAGDEPLEGVFIAGDDQPCYRMAFERGGDPMSPGDIASAMEAGAITPESWHSLDIHGGDSLDGALRGATAAWYYAPSAKSPREMTGARLWFGDRPDQRQDPAPTFTVRGVTQVDGDSVRLLQ